MFKWPWKRERRIAFIDGDQSLPDVLRAHQKYIVGTNTETHLVRLITPQKDRDAEPRILRNLVGINKIYLGGFSTGKEVTDKFIGAYIQKAINDGYTHISVISSDYDFIDIFKLAIVLDERAKQLTFRMIVPTKASKKLNEMPDRLLNIEIVRD
jgi:hypothetical protein